MHVRPVTRTRPSRAIYIEQVLDIISSFIAVIAGLEELFGFDLSKQAT